MVGSPEQLAHKRELTDALRSSLREGNVPPRWKTFVFVYAVGLEVQSVRAAALFVPLRQRLKLVPDQIEILQVGQIAQLIRELLQSITGASCIFHTREGKRYKLGMTSGAIPLSGGEQQRIHTLICRHTHHPVRFCLVLRHSTSAARLDLAGWRTKPDPMANAPRYPTNVTQRRSNHFNTRSISQVADTQSRNEVNALSREYQNELLISPTWKMVIYLERESDLSDHRC